MLLHQNHTNTTVPMRSITFLPLLLLLAGTTLHANNIQVTNTTLVDNTGSTVKVQFDISWENSWRGGGVANWDAAWVFVKYQLSNGAWGHARLGNTGHTVPTGSLMEMGLLTPGSSYDATTNPVIGTFLRRDADGTGTFSASGVQLFWDHAAQGILASNDLTAVQVFAVEMVYVNEGPFMLGGPGLLEHNKFQTAMSQAPFQVTSEAPLVISSTGFWAMGHIVAGTLGAAFPKGYAASYVMKYEISQKQLVDFLNTLLRVQQDLCVLNMEAEWVLNGQNTNDPIYRQGVGASGANNIGAPVHFHTYFPFVASNYLDRSLLYRYLDWSGLRPMSEMEYEKACRGPLPPTGNEYAWGTEVLAITANAYTLTDPGYAGESILTGFDNSGNANFTAAGGDAFIVGPFRVGIFAAHPNNNGRAGSGASYYGIMELTGNVGEQVVGVSTLTGQSYTGIHGNGTLDTWGLADVPGWPIDLMVRGGSFFSGSFQGYVSYRQASSTSGGGPPNGGRGVRTAP